VTFAGLCVYCGLPTPRGPTCVAHTDLPKLDPAFGLASVLAMVQYPALVLEDRAPAPKAQRIAAYER
jgi:hypothetical protein